jgi:minor extracellular serine protease Vpr
MRRLIFLTVIMATSTVAQLRPAMVVLRAPCLVDYLAAGEPPAADHATRIRQRLFSTEGDQYRQTLRLAKAPLADRLRQRGAVVNTQTETIVNTLMIEATDADLEWLRAQPEVQAAEYAIEMRPALDAATVLIGAQQVWSQISGGAAQTGRGIKVAMVDSGIDITNSMFADSGFTAPAGFPKSDSTTDAALTNNKVIVAKNYVICSQDTECNPTFDNSAIDGVGHGSHTASIVGGNCVTSPLNTFICGVAPGVFLGNYKVFDAANHYSSSNWVLSAMDDAVADGMDVINFSGGSINTGGAAPITFLLYTPIHNAVAAGVVVAICAGNCGPNGASSECSHFGDNTIWTPAVEPDAISVGASTNSHELVLGEVPASMTITAAGKSQTVPFNPSNIPALTQTIGPAILVDVVGFDSTRLACSPLAPGSVTGKMVLALRGTCSFAVKANDAAAGGAIAVVVYDNSGEPLAEFGVNTTGATIPSVYISAASGASLIALLAANPGAVQASLPPAPYGTAGVFIPQVADQISSYSSRGPNTDYTIKPDVVAPGDIYAATQTVNTSTSSYYDPSHFNYGDGTSYATPQVAGGAAILKQQRPALTAHDIKSALVNTAAPITATQDGAPVGVMQTGAGRLNLVAAMSTTLTADPVSLSFGLITGASSGVSKSLSVSLKGVGTQAENFNVSVSPLLSDPGVQVTTSSSSIAVTPGQTFLLQLNLATTATVSGVFEGFVKVVSQTGSTSLRIPYWVMFGTPNIPAGSLVDAAAFLPTVAPGGIASLFGTGLGGDPATAAVLPLSTNLQHSTVTISQTVSGGTTTQTTPIFYTSGGQINFQIRQLRA